MNRNWSKLLLLAICVPACLQAQTAAKPATDAVPAFDVVSIRQNLQPRSGPPIYGPVASGYHAENIPIMIVLMGAFAPTHGGKDAFFMPDQIVNAPDWLHDRYDIDARLAENDIARWSDPAEQPALAHAMLQRMFEERLQLKTHREVKEKPVFELRLVKDGSKLKQSANKDLAGVLEAHPKAGQMPGGMIMAEEKGGAAILFNASMESLGTLLSEAVNRPVVDKTGLQGKFDLSLQLDFTAGPNGEAPDKTAAIISALRDQLGLKLEPAKSEVEQLVIDHIEKPSVN